MADRGRSVRAGARDRGASGQESALVEQQGTQGDASSEAPASADVPEDLPTVYVLSAIGFACLIGWELSIIYSPALTLLDYAPMGEAALLRAVTVLSLTAMFALFRLKSDWLLAHHRQTLAFGSLAACVAVGCSALSSMSGSAPLLMSVVAWALFGVAQACIMAMWGLFFSSVPTKRTAVVVCAGAVGGTLLFVIVNTSGVRWIGLAEIAFLVCASCAIAAFLSTRVSPRALSDGTFRKSEVSSIASGVSVACHGIIYGFMSTAMCVLGALPVLVCGASGVVGIAVALAWAKLASRIDVDTGIVQRVSLPLIMAGFLLFPFFEGPGRVVCGCLVNIALAHASTVAWYTSCIDNAEFQLHPIRGFASRQAPSWAGFFAGSIAGYACLFVWRLEGQDLCFAMAVISLVVIVAFSVYGGDESKTRKRLEAFSATGGASGLEGKPADEKGDPEEWFVETFKERCNSMVSRFMLTPREAEVFFILVRGRNADYIARQLSVSSATAKTHIYHIYRKLGINSQQQLMTMVENGACDEEAKRA